MLVPKKQGGNKNKLPDWIDKRKIKKEATKKDPLSEKTKNLISKYAKSSVKQVPYSYVCSGCHSSFSADLLQKQIVESARGGDSYISCPKCGKVLIVDRLIKISTKQNSKINRAANLIAVYPNQGVTPNYTPQSWVDRALLEKICHELGKYCQKFGFFNPQLRFQRGITRGSVKEGGPQNIREAEFSIEAVDNLDLRFRVLATAGITPAGKVVLPETFSTLDGREISFTKEAVADFLSGKLFAVTEPRINAPEIHFKERDFTRFREVVASKKKAQELDWEYEVYGTVYFPKAKRTFTILKSPYGFCIDEVAPDFIGVEADTFEGFIKNLKLMAKDEFGKTEAPIITLASKKTAAGIPTPGQQIEYQGKIYTIDSVIGDASVLTDETGVKTAPIPNTDLNIQATPGVVTTPGAVPPIPTTTLAEKVKNLIKRSLRDEKTLFPFTESDPDYSVAKQTDVDADFSVPYEKSNQGILPEEERAIQKMFRGGATIKPVKTTVSKNRLNEITQDYFDWLKEKVEKGLTYDRDEIAEDAYEHIGLESDYDLRPSELDYITDKVIEMYEQRFGKLASIKKTAPEKAELERMVQKCMRDKGWGHDKCMNYVAGGVWHRKGKVAISKEIQDAYDAGYTGNEDVELKLNFPKDAFDLGRELWDNIYRALEKVGQGDPNAVDKDEARDIDFEQFDLLRNKYNLTKIQSAFLAGRMSDYYNVHSLIDLFTFASKKVASPDIGVAPFIYEDVTKAVEEGKTFEETKKVVEEKHPRFEFKKEDYDEALGKEASIQKTAEPTGYHETDETGKQIPISRLRTLINDYARAGQFPPDFDLTKVMSEVSRMTRKDLEEILDKKLKNQHYPVVHAKKKTATFKDVAFSDLNNILLYDYGVTFPENSKRMLKLKAYVEGGEGFLEDLVKEWMKKTDRGRMVVGKKKITEKIISEGDQVKTLGGLSGIVSEITPNYEFRSGAVGTGYSVVLDDGRINVFSLADLEKTAKRKISQGKSVNEIIQKIRKAALTEKDVKEDIKDETEGEEKYDQMAKEVDSPKAEKALKDMADDEAEHAEELEEVVLPAVEEQEEEETEEKEASVRIAQEDVPLRRGDRVRTDSGSEGTIKSVKHPMEQWSREELEYSVLLDGANIPLVYSPSQLTKISKKIAQEEETEEKPKVEYKELKTKPHKPELEVEEAVVATPEMQKVFHEIKDHEQRLDEIKAIVNSARQKVEEEIRKVQEEHKSVKEAEEMSQAIEKLASLLDESEKKLVDAGEFFVWLDTSMKEKKFKPSDKWRVEKLLEKFGEEAKKYLEKAENGAASLDKEIKQRLLTVFPKREGSIEKKADVLDSIKELGTGLWNYIKEISSILSEGEQLDLEVVE